MQSRTCSAGFLSLVRTLARCDMSELNIAEINKKNKELELLHSHALLNIQDLSITQIRLMEKAITALSIWSNIFSIDKNKLKQLNEDKQSSGIKGYLLETKTGNINIQSIKEYFAIIGNIQDDQFSQCDVNKTLNFLTMLEVEINAATDQLSKNEDFKKLLQIKRLRWNFGVLYYPELAFTNAEIVLYELLINQLSLFTFPNELENFFTSSNFECLYDSVIGFKEDVLKCYCSIVLIQNAREGDNIADNMIKSTQLISSLVINRMYSYQYEKDKHEKDIVKQKNIATRHLKGNKAKNKYPNMFSDKVKELYQDSEYHPNKSKSVKAMIEELKKYSINELKGYWPRAEDDEHAIYRLLIKK